MSLTKKDILASIVTGFTTGLIVWQALVFTGIQLQGVSFAWLMLVVPVLWIIGVEFGYFLGRYISFFTQFGRYVAVGFTNAAVDLGVLNLLIALTSHSSGWQYAVFKGISFIVAVLHSYFWNKSWTFHTAQSSNGRSEFSKFFLVNVVTFLLNVSLASLTVHLGATHLSIAPRSLADLGALVGSGMALVFNFIGFKLLVFRK